MKIEITTQSSQAPSGGMPAPLTWLPKLGVRAADGHELVGHNYEDDKWVYADIVGGRALLTQQAHPGVEPTAFFRLSERKPTPAEKARISMSNLPGQVGSVFDGEIRLGLLHTDLADVRPDRSTHAFVDSRFEVPNGQHRLYVFDTTDRKALKFPLIGVYDLRF